MIPKGMLSRERKKFNLKGTRRTKLDPLLSGYCHVLRNNSSGFVRIRFSQTLVDYVGTRLPDGLRPDKKAMLRAIQISECQWLILAGYLDGTNTQLLWATDQEPMWVKQSYIDVDKERAKITSKSTIEEAQNATGSAANKNPEPTRAGGIKNSGNARRR